MLASHAFQIVAFADAPFAPKESEPVEADPHCHMPRPRSFTRVGKTTMVMTSSVRLCTSQNALLLQKVLTYAIVADKALS